MDFKISDTNSGKKSVLHNGYSYRIDVVLFHLPFGEQGQQTLNSTLANGRTVVESRYHNFGLDSEIQSVYLKIPVKAINFCAI